MLFIDEIPQGSDANSQIHVEIKMYVCHVNNIVVLFRKIFALDTRDQGCSEAEHVKTGRHA